MKMMMMLMTVMMMMVMMMVVVVVMMFMTNIMIETPPSSPGEVEFARISLYALLFRKLKKCSLRNDIYEDDHGGGIYGIMISMSLCHLCE